MATKNFCDRCDEEVKSNMKLVSIANRDDLAKINAVVKPQELIELCDRCTNQFRGWVRRGLMREMTHAS